MSAVLVLALSCVMYRGQVRTPCDPSLPACLEGRSPLISAVGATRVGALFLLVVDVVLSRPLDDRVWLPPQVVQTSGGTVVGYVLRHEGGARTDLTDRRREVLLIPDHEAERADYCVLVRARDGRSAWDRPRGEAPTRRPVCP
jgi:hypothetical protein